MDHEHPLTVEGQLEGLGKFASGIRRGPRWAVALFFVLVVVPVILLAVLVIAELFR